MHWQDFIDIKLNYQNNLPRLITDQTGILYSDVFLSWLAAKSVEVKVTDSFAEIRPLVDYNKQVLIITTKQDIPAFIQNKVEHIVFTHKDLPLNGDIHKALKNAEPIQIIEILDYVFSTNQHQVLSSNDFETILKNAQQFSSVKYLSILSDNIKSLIEKEPNTNNILELAELWGKLIYQSYKTNNSDYQRLIPQIDAFSDAFINSNGMEQAFYASTDKQPKTLDKILANIKAEKQKKMALVCFDCMGYAEWHLLKEFLSNFNFQFDETAVFTLLPSLTSISRSAIFQGNSDVYHLKYPGRKTEEKEFSNYFSSKQTKYYVEGDEISLNTLLGYEYISILYNFYDELSHSAQFPPNTENKQIYFQSVLAYLEKSTVVIDFQVLLENDFQIYICSDHGSVVAKGNGKRVEKYLSDDFAKRAVIVNNETKDLINERKIKIPFVDDKLLVLPEGRTMFAIKNQIEVNHGGITVEEMVVPYIKLTKK
jgi:hypothetical protein